jgi:hypothetical protein
MEDMARGELLYENQLASEGDVADWVLEGQAGIGFHEGTLRLSSLLDESEGQRANYVYWCPQDFPADVWLEWDFWPERARGLCIVFFGAKGRGGEDLFDPSLPARTGQYGQYHSGAINALHLSYYRRRDAEPLNTCNLRKSYGFHLVAQGADPIPSVEYAKPPYHLRLAKRGPHVRFWINDLPVLAWEDDEAHGPVMGGGKIGFRQMSPMVGRYANLRVYEARS